MPKNRLAKTVRDSYNVYYKIFDMERSGLSAERK